MKQGFDPSLLDSAQIIKKSYSALIQNAGKAVAVITGIVATLVTFTEISFSDFGTKSFTTNAILMLIASYIIYFSLEDSGERLGKESDEYRQRLAEYNEKRSILYSKDISDLRGFCLEYSEEELLYRRKNLLLAHGLSYSDYERYLAGERFSRRSSSVFRRVKRMRPVALTPRELLSREHSSLKSELSNPEYAKTARLALRLIPSSVCMLFTVSVMLSAKDGMSAEFILESILKLSALPILGIKGYSQGYTYARNDLALWLQTKTKLIDAFLERQS